MATLRNEVIEEVKVILESQQKAAEKLNYVSMGDISSLANNVVGSSFGVHMTMAEKGSIKKITLK